jgi:hypothetical protein
MKRVFAVVAFVAVVSMAAFAEHWTGYVSDEQCALSGAKAKKASDWINPKAFESCAQKCAKNGSPVVFVTEDNKILKFDADSTKKAMPLLGHRVSLSGKLENGTLKVDKISSIKMDSQAKPSSDQEEKMHDQH